MNNSINYNSSKNDNCAFSGRPFNVPISLKYSTTVDETLPRFEKSSIDKNAFSSLAWTILFATLSPSPGTIENGGINVFPSIM